VSSPDFQVGILAATVHQRLFIPTLKPCQRQRDTQVLARKWCSDAREHKLQRSNHLVGVSNRRRQALVNIRDKTRGTREEIKDLFQANEIFLLWSYQDNEIIGVERSTVDNCLSGQW
jgi:hypothetical protein